MSRAIVLCEGPDDLVALRELSLLLLGASIVKRAGGVGAGAGGTGEDRRVSLLVGKLGLDMISGKGGKSQLPLEAAQSLAVLPPLATRGEDRVVRLVVVFDPNGSTVKSFHDEIELALTSHAPDWAFLKLRDGMWSVRRQGARPERLLLRAVGWCAPGLPLGALPDHHCLERLLCEVARRAYPQEAALVERWLEDIDTLQGPGAASWKAAIHLFCALIEPKQSPLNVAARILKQNPACKPHVNPVLEEAGLSKVLLRALGPR